MISHIRRLYKVISTKLDIFVNYYRGMERTNILLYWGVDLSHRIMVYCIIMWYNSFLILDGNSWQLVIGIILGMVYSVYFITSNIVSDYYRYLRSNMVMNSVIEFISYRRLRNIMEDYSFIKIRGNTDVNSGVYMEEEEGFIGIGTDRSHSIGCWKHRIGNGEIIIKTDRVWYMNGMVIQGSEDTDIVSYSIAMDSRLVYVLGFFGWIWYRYRYQNNYHKVYLTDKHRIRMYGTEVYRLFFTGAKKIKTDPIGLSGYSGYGPGVNAITGQSANMGSLPSLTSVVHGVPMQSPVTGMSASQICGIWSR